MKLIIIYGPPAAGKLTTARMLGSELCFPVVDLNFTSALSRSLFTPGTDEYRAVNRRLRYTVIEAAARGGLPGLIMTYWYRDPFGDLFVKPLLELCERESIEPLFVFLSCTLEKLFERVENPDRREGTIKITDVEKLKGILDTMEFVPIPYVESLSIDNTDVSLEEVRERIIEHFGLKPEEGGTCLPKS